MKTMIFTILFFSSISFTSLAQDTSKVEQYCKLMITGWGEKVVIDIDFGQERKNAGFRWLKDDASGKIRKFNSTVDALNYMGTQGWTLVNAFPMVEASSTIYHFYFKKLFKKEDNK